MSGFVYFIGGDPNHYKVGYASNPEKRLKAIQCGNPHKLFIAATFATGSRFDEGKIRNLCRVDGCGAQGEWLKRHLIHDELIELASDGITAAEAIAWLTERREAYLASVRRFYANRREQYRAYSFGPHFQMAAIVAEADEHRVGKGK